LAATNPPKISRSSSTRWATGRQPINWGH
jgi:hypothetical protein